MPATCPLIGAPPLIRARDPPQMLAMEEEPLDSIISETRRIV